MCILRKRNKHGIFHLKCEKPQLHLTQASRHQFIAENEMYVLQLLSLSHPLSYKIMQENKIKRRMSENIWVRQNLNSRPFVLGEYISPKQKKKKWWKVCSPILSLYFLHIKLSNSLNAWIRELFSKRVNKKSMLNRWTYFPPFCLLPGWKFFHPDKTCNISLCNSLSQALK